MSFVNILQKIFTVVAGVEHIAAPIAETLLPGFAPIITTIDGIFQKLQGTIATVEANNPVTGQGAVKSQAVIADFEAGLAFTQYAFSLEGKKLTYDLAALQEAINAQVAAYNAMSKVKDSFHIVPV